MGWAALIPLAAQVIGSMGKSEEQQQPQQALPPPPSLGQILNSNDQAYQPQLDLPYMQPTGLVKVGSNG